MKAFWQENCTGATLEDVLLDSRADMVDASERAEVSALLPDLGGKRLLELGAGIG